MTSTKSRNKYSKGKPWISDELKKLSRKKNKLYRRSILNPSSINAETYKKCKNQFTSLVRKAKKAYYSNTFAQASKNIKTTWHLINHLLNRTKSPFTAPVVMNSKKGVLSNPVDIANGFNDFFVSVGFELASNINGLDIHPCSLIKGQYPPFYNFDPPTVQEVRNIIFSLKNAAHGHDGIKSVLIKETIDYIIKPLTHILSLSLKTGIVPQNLKVARVIPIFKTGDSKEFSNYRPISILPCISKILERLVFSRLFNHLDANNILYKHQYGFRKRHSTEHALIQLVNYISSALDNKKFALGVFLDLSKAFDTVSHNILIAKLSRYGVEDVALRWFRSYLANREQYVYLEGYTSMKSQIMIGVPQGSILGPLLFLIYINDMAMTCTKLLPVLFADDTNLVASHQDFNILIKTVNEELSYIVEWFQWNKLTLNIKKCNFMIFCNTNKHYPIELSKIFINDTQIELVQHTRFLGVIIDSGLKWSNHINFVSKRSAKMLGILRRVCPLVHSSAFLTLYYSFLFPFINYCNIVWAATYPTYLKKLIVIQKKYLRFISHSNRYAPSAPLYNKFKVLPIDKVNIYQTCLLMHTFIYRKQDLPDSFQSLFTPISHVHSFQTRHSNNNLLLPYTQTTRHQFNISFRGPKLWSDLSPSLRSMSSYSAFKKHLKRLLLLA